MVGRTLDWKGETEPRRRAGGNGGRGNPHLLRLPGGALAADSHQQPARAHPARDPAAHACRGTFPHGQSALNLAAARLRHIAGTAWSTKKYLNIQLWKDQQMRAPSPREPGPGAAQPNRKCERFWTLPSIQPMAKRLALGECD